MEALDCFPVMDVCSEKVKKEEEKVLFMLDMYRALLREKRYDIFSSIHRAQTCRIHRVHLCPPSQG